MTTLQPAYHLENLAAKIWGEPEHLPFDTNSVEKKLDTKKTLQLFSAFGSSDRAVEQPVHQFSRSFHVNLQNTAERKLFNLCHQHYNQKRKEFDVNYQSHCILRQFLFNIKHFSKSLDTKEVFSDEWWYKYASARNNLKKYPLQFLSSLGWLPVLPTHLEAGDIAIYTKNINKNIQGEHFGKITDVNETNVKVFSVFKEYGPANHALEVLPSEYGNYVYFMRKVDTVDNEDHLIKTIKQVWGNSFFMLFSRITFKGKIPYNELYSFLTEKLKDIVNHSEYERLCQVYKNSIIEKTKYLGLYGKIQNTAGRALFHIAFSIYAQQTVRQPWLFINRYDVNNRRLFYLIAQKIDGFSKIKESVQYLNLTSIEYALDRKVEFGFLNLKEELEKLHYHQIKIEQAKSGDLVLYYWGSDYPLMNHIGRIYEIKDGEIMVESKIRNDGIVLHEIELVPESYGDTFLCMTKSINSKL